MGDSSAVPTGDLTNARRRRRRRRASIVVVVLGVVLIGPTVYRIATRRPAPRIDYRAQIQQLVESAQPEGANGWSYLRAASNAFIDEYRSNRSPRGGTADFVGGRTSPFVRDRVELELLVCDRMNATGVLDALGSLRAHERVIRPIVDHRVTVPESLIERLWMLCAARVFDMYVASIDGDEDAGQVAFEDALAIGRAVASQPDMAAYLSGMRCIQSALQEVRCQIAEGPISLAHGRRLREAIARQTDIPAPTLAIESTRRQLFDMVQTVYTDDGHGDGRFRVEAVGNPNPNWIDRMIGAFDARKLASRTEAIDLINEFFDGVCADTALPYVDRASDGFDYGAFSTRLGARLPFLATIATASAGSDPTFVASLRSIDIVRLEITATDALLAIEMYRAEHGRLPASWSDLVPAQLAQIPIDPLNGRPLVYRLNHDLECGYELYSLGADGIDDGAGPESRYPSFGADWSNSRDISLTSTRPRRP